MILVGPSLSAKVDVPRLVYWQNEMQNVDWNELIRQMQIGQNVRDKM